MRKFVLPLSLLFFFTPLRAQFSLNALDFDGANDMVVVNSVPALFSSPGTNDFTIEAWVNPRASAFQRIFFAQPSTTNFVALGTGNGNVIYFYVVVNGTTYSVVTTPAITQNQWTHVTARWTSATASPQVFFNGVLQAGTGGGTSSTGTSGLMTLGTRPGGFQYFNGLLDEVRVWSTARSQCQITGNMNRSINASDPTLLVNYDFNQGVAGGSNAGVTSLPDLSGNAYNGTLTNFTLTGATSNWVTSAASLTTQGAASSGGYTASNTDAVCSGASYTFIDGSTQNNITSQVVHVSTIPGPGGCDSVFTTTVNVNPVYAISDTASLCSGSNYTFPDGSNATNVIANTSHTSNLLTVLGCDSLITTFIEVLSNSLDSVAVSVCPGDSLSFPDGSGMVIDSAVTHTSLLQNVNGCDSVIVTLITLNASYNQIATAEVCSGGSYTFADGSTQTNITSQVTHTSQLSTILGCDSLITTTVSAVSVDTSVAVDFSSHTLTAQAVNASYQWLDCLNGMSPIAGETSAQFSPTPPGGVFAVAVTQNGCTDTSSCYEMLLESVDPLSLLNQVRLYPNPVEDALWIDAGALPHVQVQVLNLPGVVLQDWRPVNGIIRIDFAQLPVGTYLIKLRDRGAETYRRVVVH